MFMRKILHNFIHCGILGWCLEITFTALNSFRRREFTLSGNTSVWMFPIYGMGALLAPVSRWVDLWIADGSQGAGTPLNPIDKIIRHGFLYMVLIFTAEYLAGMFLRNMGICPWDYTGRHLNVNGLIRLDFAPLWFLTGLLFEQLTSLKRV